MLYLRRFKAQTVEESSSARLRAVAACALDFAVQLGLPHTVGFTSCQLLLQLAKFRVAVDNVFDSQSVRGGRLLRHMSDNQILWHVEIPGVCAQLIHYQGEQTGLASAVSTGDTDFVPAMNRKRRMLQEHSRAASN